MTILLIRHSLAVEREEWRGNDLQRPLTRRGVKRAYRFFDVLSKIYPKIDYIIVSKAQRTKQTGEILKKFYPDCVFEQTGLLYPGAVKADFEEALKDKNGIVAVVGHEPDLSNYLKDIMHSPNLNVKFSKPSVAVLEEGVLKGLFQYKQFKAIYEKSKKIKKTELK
jgi:phosphohistidine phosphatase